MLLLQSDGQAQQQTPGFYAFLTALSAAVLVQLNADKLELLLSFIDVYPDLGFPT
jgi:hypothetical protein